MKPVLALGILACFAGVACTARTETQPAAPAPAAPAPAAPAPQPDDRAANAQEVPAAFRGHWDTNAGTCGSGTSDGRLTISARRMEWYESAGPVEAVTVKGPREVTIASKLSGEGETWTDLTTYRLSEDGKTLTDVTDPNETHPMVRVRCPGG